MVAGWFVRVGACLAFRCWVLPPCSCLPDSSSRAGQTAGPWLPWHTAPPVARQVPIFDLLRKFDGQRGADAPSVGVRRFRITRLPRFLVLHMKRFTKNQFFREKNPTIVNFPVKNLELADVIPVPQVSHACQHRPWHLTARFQLPTAPASLTLGPRVA